MPACEPLPVDRDPEIVAGRHDGASGQAERALRHARPVVHAEHRFHGEFAEQAVVDHALGAAPAFFGGLEDDVHDAIEIPVRGQVAGGAQQHGRVSVVAARVHFAGVLARVRGRC